MELATGPLGKLGGWLVSVCAAEAPGAFQLPDGAAPVRGSGGAAEVPNGAASVGEGWRGISRRMARHCPSWRLALEGAFKPAQALAVESCTWA